MSGPSIISSRTSSSQTFVEGREWRVVHDDG
jgi:hypothetical protein